MSRVARAVWVETGSCLIVHITPADVRNLERIFAVMTDEGWVLPDWLCNLAVGIG